jgi:hypothetical protein
MAYKRYIKKNGKIYGPYNYYSHRKNGKVVSKYLGKEGSVKDKFQWNSLFIVLLGFILLLSVILLVNFSFTGKVALDIKSKYVAGEEVEGNLEFSLKEGELIPADSRLIIELGDEVQEFFLSELVDFELVEGEFYAENTNVSGNGKGYGLIGSKKIYPELDFELRIFDLEIEETGEVGEVGQEDEIIIEDELEEQESEEEDLEEEQGTNESEEESEVEEEQEDEEVIEEDLVEDEQEDEEEPAIEEGGADSGSESEALGSADEDSDSEESSDGGKESSSGESSGEETGDSEESSSESSSSSGDSDSSSGGSSDSGSEGSEEGNSGAGITGSVISETEEIVSGVVSKKNDFVYEFSEGKTAELVSGSVNLDGNEINDSAVKVNSGKKKVVVSTNYFIEESGFGGEFLGNKGLKLEINLEQFGLIVENDSELVVRLVYEDEVLVEEVKDLVVEVEENETEIEEDLVPVNITKINITEELFNETTINETIVVSNLSISFNTTQYGAVLNKPVKWKKNIKLDKEGVVRVEIPKSAENIIVSKIVNEVSEEVSSNELGIERGENEEIAEEIEDFAEEVNESEEDLIEEENQTEVTELIIEEDVNESEISEEEKELATSNQSTELEAGHPKKSKKVKTRITAQVVSGEVTAKIELDRGFSVSRFFDNIFRFFTGRVIDVEEGEDTKEVVIDENATEFEIEYETPAPVAFEKNTSRGKEIVISSEVHYENILVYTELPKEVAESAVRLYWNKIEDIAFYDNETNETIFEKVETREEVDVRKYDTNNNSLVDYIEWIVPSLSNQSYELIIEITKAEHLDENRSFISDIYDYVKAKDDNWSGVISDGEYVRVTFEQNLTNERDITIYARAGCNESIKINNIEVPCEIYYKKIRIDKIRGEVG